MSGPTRRQFQPIHVRHRQVSNNESGSQSLRPRIRPTHPRRHVPRPARRSPVRSTRVSCGIIHNQNACLSVMEVYSRPTQGRQFLLAPSSISIGKGEQNPGSLAAATDSIHIFPWWLQLSPWQLPNPSGPGRPVSTLMSPSRCRAEEFVENPSRKSTAIPSPRSSTVNLDHRLVVALRSDANTCALGRILAALSTVYKQLH